MIDFSAREQHFADHLLPVREALPALPRGRFHVGDGVAVPGGEPGWPDRTGGPVVCAAWGDLKEIRRTGRPVVFCEHGAGQSYVPSRHASYAGGKGRDTVVLFLVPNDQAAARNRRWYPQTPNVVIGSPRVDQLRGIPRRAGPATVAVSFHWRCKIAPEAGTAFDHYAPGLGAIQAELAAAGVAMVGHGHPRMFRHLAPVYEAAGIEPVADFEEVVARADVLAADNSSVMFEFAALGRPVVVLNCPRYRRRVHHGLRFWSEADVGIQIDGPDQLPATALLAFEDPAEVAGARQAAVSRVYPVPAGTAAQLAADAIAAHAAGLVAI